MGGAEGLGPPIRSRLKELRGAPQRPEKRKKKKKAILEAAVKSVLTAGIVRGVSRARATPTENSQSSCAGADPRPPIPLSLNLVRPLAPGAGRTGGQGRATQGVGGDRLGGVTALGSRWESPAPAPPPHVFVPRVFSRQGPCTAVEGGLGFSADYLPVSRPPSLLVLIALFHEDSLPLPCLLLQNQRDAGGEGGRRPS